MEQQLESVIEDCSPMMERSPLVPPANRKCRHSEGPAQAFPQLRMGFSKVGLSSLYWYLPSQDFTLHGLGL